MVRGNARGARLSPPRRAITVCRWATGGGSGVRVMLFSPSALRGCNIKDGNLLLYEFDTQKYSLKHVQTL
jgi:hypothetical protein